MASVFYIALQPFTMLYTNRNSPSTSAYFELAALNRIIGSAHKTVQKLNTAAAISIASTNVYNDASLAYGAVFDVICHKNKETH